MSTFQDAIESIRHQITQATTSHTIFLKLDWSIGEQLIDWLEAQPVFPKFYWQSRDGEEEVAVLGQVKTFTDPSAAQKVLASQQRIWGGRSFDGRTERNRRCMSSFFFLPQVEITRLGSSWNIMVNVSEDNSRLLSTLNKMTEEFKDLSELHCRVTQRINTPEKADWSNMVNKALTAIENKQFEKVVLARKTTLTLDQNLSSAQFLKASRQSNSHSFHFMMALDSEHCFIGSTPERLYVRNGYALKTEALAGTIGRGHDEEEDNQLASWLISDKKNQYENRLVVDDIVHRLSKFSISMNVADTSELVKLRKVQHLKRPISAEINAECSDSQLLDNLQPTAAIAGLPRMSALDFIIDNEPFARGWYSGAVGFLSQQRSEFCVAIRSALVMGNKLHLFAGAGIVPGSEPSSEWDELDRKTSTLCTLLESDTNVSSDITESQVA
ncbi:isochorismate synthase [Aliivibrio fischeri]|uniref:isochorismate synthase n=1 Tax=Aliivibrio fischeri TaxID=668 RepID=UPI0007C54EFC|nr:isochorismate synthase [Aliivibrio fischeri]MBP3142324.1 isochorismate synthase [Aliivibrio fischeri]MBP3157050.1 isochorismate synthase [Aliivibrio fischeri]MCE7572657.1 isochorismate synthase [Aliivibrio fischeri]